MKKLFSSLIAVVFLALISSCGVNNAFMLNHNQNATQVHLASNNFRVVNKVSGSADVTYVLIFGGMNKRQLYQNAYTTLVNNAGLTGSKALVNIVTEEHFGGCAPIL